MAQRTTTIDDPDLIDLLEGIDAGDVGLPNFQRDFDWTDSDVRALLATVLNGWPMGSLLIIDGDADTRDFYDPRAFQFAPPIAAIPDIIVLDGQQRLTSLYAALFDRGESVHAVSLAGDAAWDDIDSLDESLRTFKRSIWDEKYESPAEQIAAQLLPVSALRSTSRFFDWRDSAAQGDALLLDKLTMIYRKHLSGLYRYRMPALRITKDTHPAAVARIFERVNKTGQQLGAFDLMVARSFTPEFNLRVAWEHARESYPELGKFFDGDGLAPLQVIALRALGDVRASAVLKLTPTAIHDYWERAAKSLAAAVRFARKELGVLTHDWLPYNSLLVVLAAHAWSEPISPDQAVTIKRWFWRSSLTARYAVGSNTVAVSDFKRLEANGFSSPEAFALDWELFRDATKQSAGAIHRAWLCALAASSGERGDDLEESVPKPRSFVPRQVLPGKEASPHLFTLGFALFSDDQIPLARQFLPEHVGLHYGSLGDDAKRVSYFRKRLEGLAEFVGDQCNLPVSVSDDSSQAEGGRGD